MFHTMYLTNNSFNNNLIFFRDFISYLYYKLYITYCKIKYIFNNLYK